MIAERGRPVRLLLDSHVFLWWAVEPDRLRPEALVSIRDPGTFLSISTATIWELEIKQAKGQLVLPADVWTIVQPVPLDMLPISPEDAIAAARLPRHHSDPFDRMVVAQALARDLVLVTRDRALKSYGARILDG